MFIPIPVRMLDYIWLFGVCAFCFIVVEVMVFIQSMPACTVVLYFLFIGIKDLTVISSSYA